MKKYVVRDREAGNVIEYVETMGDGLELIKQYEADDKANGIYEPDFYEVAQVIRFEED